MNFFERQDIVRRQSKRLVLLFLLAVLAIVGAIDLLLVIAFSGFGEGHDPAGALVLATVLTIAVITCASMFRMASLRKGGAAVAHELGATPVPETTSDPQLRRLRNVVEEIAIASSVPVPQIFVLDEEEAINAFAAGYSPSDAAVTVTRGALNTLNRDELQGVIAHEFSHVLNGDMRLNIRLMGVLFGILMLAIIGRKVLELGRGRDKNAGAILVAALIAMIVGYIGLFFGRLIKAGVSRSRERLADASAVQFTRQTSGLAGALKKIGGIDEGSKLSHRSDAEEISHMLFGDGVGLRSWFATHPPLLERIRVLEPGFTSDQLARLRLQWHALPPNGLDEDVQMEFASARAMPSLPASATEQTVTPAGVVAQVAQPGADDYRAADVIAAHLPEELRALAAQRDRVVPLLLALLLDTQPAVADKQGDEIAARMGKTAAVEARTLQQDAVASLHPVLRLPLASLAFPVLRRRPRPELDVFLDTVNAMVYADGNVSLFEYCLARLLTVHVRESLDPSRYARFGRRKLSGVRREVTTILTVVAQCGNTDAETARQAFLAGMLRVLPDQPLPYVPRTDGVLALDDVWVPLDALEPLAKEALVEGITATISHDGRIDIAEAELLRTICSVLHCPLPPLLGQQ